MSVFLAADIGAGSGRIIKGTLEQDRLRLDEVHRFKNEFTFLDGHHRWEIEKLFDHVRNGIQMAAESGESPVSVGVDTWGVDFTLLDESDQLLEQPVAYRDDRTQGISDIFFEIVSLKDIYQRTGIQLMELNTLFQLFALGRENRSLLDAARRMLLVPDYLNWRLSGRMENEFTEATTSQMLNLETKDWDPRLLEALNVDPAILSTPIPPGTVLDTIRPEILSGDTQVVAPATHDTGSAVASIPASGRDWAYICSGTWCLMGVESETPFAGDKAFEYNYTNEGGVEGTYRVLKNIMGLWMFENLKKEFDREYSYEELIAMAEAVPPFPVIVDVNHDSFFNPPSMIQAMDAFCEQTGQKKPASEGEYIRASIEGLGLMFRRVIGELEEITGRSINVIHIVGGGCRNWLFCRAAADATGRLVKAGPVEGTSTGNIIMQARSTGRIASLDEGRALVGRSFDIQEYTPADTAQWDEAWQTYTKIKGA